MSADKDSSMSGVSERLQSVTPADIDAIAAIYEREMPRLVMFVVTTTSLDVHAAADVAQTAFERAVPRWPALENPKAWLYRVARNEAIAGAKRSVGKCLPRPYPNSQTRCQLP